MVSTRLAPWQWLDKTNATATRVRKLLSVVLGIMLMLSTGALYAISSWNAQLKEFLHFSQAQISFVTSMASFGAYLSVFPGFLFDRIGPHASVLLYGIALATIFLSLHTGLVHSPKAMTPWILGICFAAIGLASCLANFASMVANEALFGERNRGKVLSLMASSYSAGGALFAFVYHHEFDHQVPKFFHFMGIMYLTASLLGFIGLYRDCGHLHSQHKRELDQLVPKSSKLHSNVSESGSSKDSDLVEDFAAFVALDQPFTATFPAEPRDTLDITGRELLSDPRFWLLFVPVLVVIGSALFVMSNVAFIVESLGGPMDQVPVMIAGFSLANTVVRLITGTVSDNVISKWPRAWFVALACVVMAGTHLSFLVFPAQWLLASVLLAGVSEGIMFGVWPVLIREAFGIKHFGKNYGFVSLSIVVGFPVLLSPLSSLVYHSQADQHPLDASDTEKCFGTKCFEPIFLLVISMCVIALYCAIKLTQHSPCPPPLY